MNKFEYKNLTPFKWFVLENFPFIEADFDALTNWQLFCKLGKEMNKIINSENALGTQMENVTNAFIDLQNYVNNYFDNLDVQDEINNKLNEMAESGELSQIIDEQIFSDINNQLSLIESENTIFIGDSYGDKGVYPNEKVWVEYVAEMLGLTLGVNAFNFCAGGAGFSNDGVHTTYLNALQTKENIIQNKNLIKNIIICGGANDYPNSEATIKQDMETFINYCKLNYPNAKIFVGMIGCSGSVNSYGNRRSPNLTNVLNAYQQCNLYGATYLNGVEYIMHNGIWISEDGIHPTSEGQKILGRAIYQSFKTGYFTLYYGQTIHNIGQYLKVYKSIINNTLQLVFDGQLVTDITLSSYANVEVEMTNVTKEFLNPVNLFSQIPVDLVLIIGGNRHVTNGVIQFNVENGLMKLIFTPPVNTGTVTNIIIKNSQYNFNLLLY